ncbi:MAG: aminotransferase class III-fold pyridoxal phosphate-dependent enzyme [Desulfobacterales bacterium]
MSKDYMYIQISATVGMALKLARAATGKFKTISMWDSFYGASLDTMSISGETILQKKVGPLLPGAVHVPPADPYRCLWDPEGSREVCGLKCAAYVDYVLEKEGDVGAVIVEPVRNTAVNPFPPGYWKTVRMASTSGGYTSVLMQGSGTFCVESVKSHKMIPSESATSVKFTLKICTA